MNRTYNVALEISGPTAMWTRPDTGDAPVSYPAPTYSAAKGIFESIAWLRGTIIIPTKVEICAPLIYHNYTTNYGGPLRKKVNVKGGTSFQLIATVLVNVCYRLYADLDHAIIDDAQLSESARSWLASARNAPHAYQAMFERRLKKGQCHSVPCLGWKEFVADYCGPFRANTRVCENVDISLPSMLERVFSPDGDIDPTYRPTRIRKGVLNYAE